MLQKMSTIREESDCILKLFVNGSVPQKDVQKAQELFRALKEQLHAEYKRMATVKGQASLSDFESRFYKPAVDDAWANTAIGRVRWNTRPDNNWHEALWSVSDYMRYWSKNLQDVPT